VRYLIKKIKDSWNKKNYLDQKEIVGKILLYLILISVIYILGYIQYKISGFYEVKKINNAKELLKTVKYFVISYVILEFLNFIFQHTEKKLKRSSFNYFFLIPMIIGIIVTVFSYFISKTVFFSFLILYILILPFVISLIGLKIKDIKYIGIRGKLVFGNYIIYSLLILLISMKWDDLKYLTFQLIVFCKIFDYLKDIIVSTLIGWNLKEINGLKQLIKNNTDKIKKKESEKLIEQLKEAFEFSNIENIKEKVVELSNINLDYLCNEKLKIEKKVIEFKKNNRNNEKLCKKLDKILSRKFKTIIEFQIYKIDIEKIIGKVDD
jgi:membrane protein